MTRISARAVLSAVFCLAALPALAADLFTVAGIPVDASAQSGMEARSEALAQGQPAAWQRLFRRLAPQSAWDRQPQLDAGTLQHMIRSFEVSNERRSTIRYLADITYHFDPSEVERVLRQTGVPYTETQAKPVLVVPIVSGQYDSNGPWAKAWASSSIAQGLVPILLPSAQNPDDQAVLTNPKLTTLDWSTLGAMAQRYNVLEVVVAEATPDGNSALLNELTAAGQQSESVAFANSSFVATADAAAQLLATPWKNRSAVDYSQKSQLTADVQYSSPGDWTRIRNALAAVKSIADLDIVGLSLHEASVQLTYFGRPTQLKDALAQQNLAFGTDGGQYTVQLAAPSANP